MKGSPSIQLFAATNVNNLGAARIGKEAPAVVHVFWNAVIFFPSSPSLIGSVLPDPEFRHSCILFLYEPTLTISNGPCAGLVSSSLLLCPPLIYLMNNN
jgi:hypothetical protein